MKTGLGLAAALLAAPLLAVSAVAVEPEEKAAQSAEAEKAAEEDESAEGAPEAAKAPKAKAEEKRICRRVRLDASSRRATKVCKTKEEWRLFNQRR